MKSLENLCRPLIRTLCEYWYFAKNGVELDSNVVDHTLRDHLARIRETVEDDARLKREFKRIEQPLVFFIDYTVKEGPFRFRDSWQEIARDYNELSGDEKFFELLGDNLDDPDSSERLMLFYLFMGQGFDGAHSGDRDFILRKMKVCATRLPISAGNVSSLSAADVMKPPAFSCKARVRIFSIWTMLTLLSLITIASLIWNVWVFSSETRDYRNALDEAVRQAENRLRVKSVTNMTLDKR